MRSEFTFVLAMLFVDLHNYGFVLIFSFKIGLLNECKFFNHSFIFIQESKRLAQSQSALPNGDAKVKPEH